MNETKKAQWLNNNKRIVSENAQSIYQEINECSNSGTIHIYNSAILIEINVTSFGDRVIWIEIEIDGSWLFNLTKHKQWTNNKHTLNLIVYQKRRRGFAISCYVFWPKQNETRKNYLANHIFSNFESSFVMVNLQIEHYLLDLTNRVKLHS